MSSSLIGRKLGQNEVVSLLGRGGMATVYKGYQASLDRFVAIKVLPPHPGMDDQFIERFRLEARTIGSLQNPNILPLYDYGTEGDVLYLVMAYVSGGSLADYLDGKLDTKQIEKWLRGIASGLDFAHRRGIVHRDIKPANILIDSDNHPLLADFGVVKMLVSSSNLTGTSLVGTPAYMSPEQGQGLEIDGRSDVYSLGVMVYEMLTGQHPFSADTPMQTILKHITDPVPDILLANSSLSSSVAAVMKKVLAKDPTDRYSTAIAFAEDFSNAIHGNVDSLVAARQAMPLNREPLLTLRLDANPVSETSFNAPVNTQTIVVRETTNPILILGAIGIIALVIVVVAIALITAPRDSGIDFSLEDLPDDILAMPSEIPVSMFELGEDFRGFLRYNTSQNIGDTVSISLFDLRTAPSDTKYVAWLANSTSGASYKLGDLTVFQTGEANLIYNQPTSETDILPAAYNAMIVTEEDASTTPTIPSAVVRYSGSAPEAASVVLASIMQTDPDGIDGGGLLISAHIEAEFGEQHAGLAANATSVIGQRQHAEHTINIFSGTQVDYDRNGDGQNPARKKGVYVYLDAIDERLVSLLLDQTVMPELQFNAENIRICIQNTRNWLNEIIEYEKLILAAESVEAAKDAAMKATTLAGFITSGFDANQNGIVEAFEGECGLSQISDYATQLANISVFEGVPDASQ